MITPDSLAPPTLSRTCPRLPTRDKLHGGASPLIDLGRRSRVITRANGGHLCIG